MIAGYHHLMPKLEGQVTVAIWPLPRIVGQEENQPFREDLQELANEATTPVVLDLNVVEWIDGTFFRNILELERGLQAKGMSLTVRVHPAVASVVRIVKLERLLPPD